MYISIQNKWNVWDEYYCPIGPLSGRGFSGADDRKRRGIRYETIKKLSIETNVYRFFRNRFFFFNRIFSTDFRRQVKTIVK